MVNTRLLSYEPFMISSTTCNTWSVWLSKDSPAPPPPNPKVASVGFDGVQNQEIFVDFNLNIYARGEGGKFVKRGESLLEIGFIRGMEPELSPVSFDVLDGINSDRVGKKLVTLSFEHGSYVRS